MSLVNTLMNGGFSGVSVDASKYTHNNGALRIATESVEELHDIFLEFYDMEQAELAAIHEGVALEGSQYQAVAEAAIGNAITKIKDFFKKLWEKVKAFFKNVKMYLDAMFMKAKDFVKKYKKVIQEANKDIKDFEYNMYDYNNAAIDDAKVVNEFDPGSFTSDIMTSISSDVKKALYAHKNEYRAAQTDAERANADSNRNTALQGQLASSKDLTDEDKVAVKFVSFQNISGKGINVKSRDDLSEAFFAYFRNGATSSDDKDDIEVKDLMHYVTIVEESKASKIDKYGSKVDKAYKDAIKDIDDLESEINKANTDKDTTMSEAAQVLRNVSKGYSLYQSFHNSLMDAWKTAATERDNTYKSLLLAGISNAKKNKGK